MRNKTDKRIINTKNKIKNSFISLLEEKEIEKITVKEICEKADVTRGTFYAHYENEYDLLKALIIEMVTRAFKIIQHLPEPGYSHDEKIVMLTKMFDYLKSNRILLWYFVNRNTYEEISVIAKDFFYALCLKKAESVDSEKVQAAYMFTGCGILGLLNFWINDNCTIGSEKIAVYFKSIIDGGIREFIHSNK